MTDKKQILADLRAELADRQIKAEAAQRSQTELTQRIRSLSGAMVLDGDIDHSPRIAQVQTELNAASAYLATWPDVEQELNRRISEAEQALSADKLIVDTQRYTVLADLEAQQRREFASNVVALAELSQRLRATIDERDALYTPVHQGGGLPIPPSGRPSTYLPKFQPDWVYSGNVSEVKRVLAELLSEN